MIDLKFFIAKTFMNINSNLKKPWDICSHNGNIILHILIIEEFLTAFIVKI
jgi:hypothetical protein